ncbi:MAG: ATP-binding cassette domain-containing protein [Clostridiales bacterium]|nr:ATP-binding cassette domain-containing protein [Clostridiales bacterium]
MSDLILEMRNITKEFPGVKALDNVTFKVEKGEIHCLIGENGAGKSTLMKVLSGVYPYGTYSGDIVLNDAIQKFNHIKDSEKASIAIIYQELALIPHMSIYENIFLGNEISKKGLIDWNETIVKAKEVLEKVGLTDDPSLLINKVGVGKQQLIEIAKALAKDVKLLILDEPTAALNEDDSENLLKILKELKNQGITSILISHKLNEVMHVADSITVLRDGQTIKTLDVKKDSVSEDEIIKMMVGREMTNRYPSRVPDIGEVVFEVKNWNVFSETDSSKKIIKNVSFNLKKGEIVGISGLMGSGRTELAMSVFGKSFGSKISGELFLNGNKIDLNSPKEAIDNRISYLTEDRKEKGLILIEDVKQNISIAALKNISKKMLINENEEIKNAGEYIDKMKIKTPSVEQLVGKLSGGNQQKIALSKWMETNPQILIVDEPTRGIDVGAKYEIYNIMNEFVAQGNSIIMISSEMPEILGMSDRVYVMNEGQIVALLENDDMNQETIMKHSIGHGGKSNE